MIKKLTGILASTIILSTSGFAITDNDDYTKNMKETVIPTFVQNAFHANKKAQYTPYYFTSKNAAKDGSYPQIAYAKIIDNNKINNKAIVIVPGMSEGFMKYSEVVYDLFLSANPMVSGYDIYLIDNRGQGYSDRLISNKDAEYVNNFDSYIKDLDQLIKTEINTKKYDSVVLFGHSMGGAIVSKYMEDYCKIGSKTKVKGAVLCSPMIQPETGVPEFIAKALAEANCFAGRSENYALGCFGMNGKRAENVKFNADKDKTTRSSQRWANWEWNLQGDKSHETVLQAPSINVATKLIPLGNESVTWKWLQQGIKGASKIRKNKNNFDLPVMLFQAGEDAFVKLDAQNDFCAVDSGNRLIVRFETARHEIYNETDTIRNASLKAAATFLNSEKFDIENIKTELNEELPKNCHAGHSL